MDLGRLFQGVASALRKFPLLAGETNPDSATNGYLKTRLETNLTILAGTDPVTIGGGAANDTHLQRVTILANGGGAVTAAITGFADNTGAAQTITLTGSTTVDTVFDFYGSINSAGAITIDPSVTLKVLVNWRPR
jgi:hypothetical protein